MKALLDTYKAHRTDNETFIATYKRVGAEPYKAAANAVRHITARHEPAPAAAHERHLAHALAARDIDA